MSFDGEHQVVFVPVSAEMLPQVASGTWIECSAVRFSARMDGIFEIVFRRDDA